MSLRLGLREVDIARRESGVISWLGFREHMTGKELSGLFAEWVTDPYAYQARMLTQLALDSLMKRELVKRTDVISPSGLGFQAFDLIDSSTADRIDSKAVELAPREIVLLGSLDGHRKEAQTAAELDARLRLQEGPDSWRTEACLGHLARLGLIYAVENQPGAYMLSRPWLSFRTTS